MLLLMVFYCSHFYSYYYYVVYYHIGTTKHLIWFRRRTSQGWLWSAFRRWKEYVLIICYPSSVYYMLSVRRCSVFDMIRIRYVISHEYEYEYDMNLYLHLCCQFVLHINLISSIHSFLFSSSPLSLQIYTTMRIRCQNYRNPNHRLIERNRDRGSNHLHQEESKQDMRMMSTLIYNFHYTNNHINHIFISICIISHKSKCTITNTYAIYFLVIPTNLLPDYLW